MKLKKVHILLSLLLLLSCMQLGAQTPTNCFAIGSILVDACGSPEGENEMYRFQVGPAPILVSDIVITWPNNPFRGFCLDQTKLDSLNATIRGCGYLLSPPGGILPAGHQVLVITSTDMNVAFNSFTNLSDTLYVLFQCAGNTNGHFANYSTTGTNQGRTLIMTDTATGCVDSVTYMKDSLITQAHTHAAQDGAGVNFDYAGHATYYNNGCNAPFIAPSVNAGNDTSYSFCTAQPVITLHGTKVGGVKSVMWYGGHGTFSQPDSLTTTYTVSSSDISPIHLYLLGRLCPDTLYDTVSITIVPPVSSSQTLSICQGSSYHIGTHTYTASGTFVDTLTTVGHCDSVVTTHLTVITATSQPITLTGCGSVTYHGTAYTASTSFIDTLRGATGCDSIRYAVSITVKNPSAYIQSIMLCAGQAFHAGGQTYTTAGTYIDTVNNSAGCDSIITTHLTYAGNSLSAGSNIRICSGDSTQLHATGGLTYAWTPAATLSNPNIANPEAHPASTTTYHVVASVASANQIVNGDFSAGNTGFSSSYAYAPVTNTVEGQYTVGTDARLWNGGMAACGDHTTGTGNMLIVNGAVTANVSIYCQTVTVAPNTSYAFSTWLQSVTQGNPAQLQFSINGTLIGPIFTATVNTCDWQQFYTTWNSGSATTAQICIVNQNTIASGNDFALDDISFSPLCTAVDSVTVTVASPSANTINASICQGGSYTYHGHVHTVAGTFTDTLTTSGGCDSIVTTHLSIIAPASQVLPLTGCGQVTYRGLTYTSNATIQDTIRASQGCDSIHLTVTIVVKHNTTYTQNPTVCQGQSVTVGTHSYTIPGTYIDTLPNSQGCDSIITTTLINAGAAVSAGSGATICQGDSTQLHATGGSTYTWTPATGLSNPNIANPYAHPTATTTYTVTSPTTIGNLINNGNFSNGNTGFSSGYTFTNSPPGAPCGQYGILGCEGYYTINTNPDNTHSQFANFGDHTTGSGSMFIVNGSTNPNISVWCQTITVLPNTTYQFSAWVANVDIYPQPLPNLEFTINGASISGYFSPTLSTGVWTQISATWNSGNNTSVNICLSDSSSATGGNDFALDDISFSQICNGASTVQVVVIPAHRDTVTATICRSNGPYTLPNGTTANTSGVYTTVLSASNGCDSTIVTKLTVDTAITQTITVPAACGQVTYNGTTYTASTTLNQHLTYQNGCDSILRTINIVVNHPTTHTQSPTICQGAFFSVGTHSYGSQGTYVDTIHGGSVAGCDSIVTTTLTVITPFQGFLSLSGTCGVSYLGQTYTSSTFIRDTLRSVGTGCDSLYLSVTITVTPVTPATISQSICINTGQSYLAGGQNQTTPGIYTDTVRTPGGCDSLIRLTHLSVITPVQVSQRIDSCYRATIDGTIYTASAVFADTVLSVLGCDSLFRTDSLIIHSPSFSIVASQTLPLVEGDSTILTIIPTGTYSNVVWSPDSNITNINAQTPTVAPKQTTTYSVVAADANNCRVSASIDIPVTANSQPDFVMPTAFSPNGDNINEVFRPILRVGSELLMFHIYDRWGELVYDKDRDNSAGWDGFFKNVSQPIGVYVYFISVKGVAGNIVKQQGNLTLLR